MPGTVRCPHCGALLRYSTPTPPAHGRCSKCKAVFRTAAQARKVPEKAVGKTESPPANQDARSETVTVTCGSPKIVLMAAVTVEQELLTNRDRAIRQGNWGKAEEVSLKLVSFDPQNASHQQVLSEVQTRRAQGARKALGLKVVKNLLLVLVLVAVVLLVAHRVQKARTDAAKEAEKLLEEKQLARSLRDKTVADTKKARDQAKAAEGRGDWVGASQAYQDLADLGEAREAKSHLQAMQQAAQAEQLEKEGKLEEAVAVYKKVAAYKQFEGALVDRSALNAKVADLEKQIARTRPRLRY